MAQSTEDLLGKTDSATAASYKKDATRYKSEGAEIQKEARALETERDKMEGKARQFHFGEVFLEVAIVLLALTILSKQRLLSYAGFGSAVVGIVWAALGFLH